MKVKIGTRKSKLALWQAYHVRDLLEQHYVEVEIIPIETKGDKVLDVSISKIGSKGVFTEELEEMLLNGEIDVAVHSAKDLQSELDDSFEILAFSKREKEHDVLVSRNKAFLLNSSNASFKIGTSSTRRVATLAHYYPNIQTVEARGNLQTRIAKMEDGLCDALLLAYAGVSRMEYGELINQELPLDVFTPAVGQGSLAIEVAKKLSDEKKNKIRDVINDPKTEIRLKCERVYLRKLKGGCSIPAFANAQIADNSIVLQAGIFSLDGQQLVKKHLRGELDKPAEMGELAGEEVLADGGMELLEKINKELNR